MKYPDVMMHIHECPVCGRDHGEMLIVAYEFPQYDGATHWGTCPRTHEQFELTCAGAFRNIYQLMEDWPLKPAGK